MRAATDDDDDYELDWWYGLIWGVPDKGTFPHPDRGNLLTNPHP